MLYWLFAFACFVGLTRLMFVRRSTGAVTPAIDSAEADAVHVVMNGTMALMPFAALPLWSGAALWLLAAILAFRAVFIIVGRSGAHASPSTPRSTGPGITIYHLLSVLAMIYAMASMHHGAPAEPAMMHHGPMDSMGMGHVGMGHMAMPADHGPAQEGGAGWLALVLGVFFLLDGLLTLGAGLFAPQLVIRATQSVAGSIVGAVPSRFSRAQYYYAAFAHVTMDLGMAWLLLR